MTDPEELARWAVENRVNIYPFGNSSGGATFHAHVGYHHGFGKSPEEAISKLRNVVDGAKGGRTQMKRFRDLMRDVGES